MDARCLHWLRREREKTWCDVVALRSDSLHLKPFRVRSCLSLTFFVYHVPSYPFEVPKLLMF